MDRAPRTAFVFPGQGSQKVGMGRAWAERSPVARAAFEEADRVLGFPLTRLAWEGPEEELTLTANAQPTLLATSVAIHRAVAAAVAAGDALPPGAAEPVALAGHSLGEYSALVAAGALDFADALRLVRRRGELMQQAVPPGEGAMAAVLALDDEAVAGVARDAAGDDVLAVANYNAPGQTVLAGHAAAVDRAVELARERGARKVVKLAVSAPFHCSLMRPAREAMGELLAATAFADPRVPVVANVSARPVRSGAEARQALVEQIDSPVRWTGCVRWMAEEAGVEQFLELGSGTVLTGLVRRIAKGARAESLGEPPGDAPRRPAEE